MITERRLTICPVAAQLHGANKIMQEVLDVLLFEDWSHYDIRCKIDEGYIRLLVIYLAY